MSGLRKRVDTLARKSGSGFHVYVSHIPEDWPEEKRAFWSQWVASEEVEPGPNVMIIEPEEVDL